MGGCWGCRVGCEAAQVICYRGVLRPADRGGGRAGLPGVMGGGPAQLSQAVRARDPPSLSFLVPCVTHPTVLRTHSVN